LNQTKVWSGSYSAPLDERWTVQFSGYQSDSNIATIGGSNVLGKGHSYGVSAIYNLPLDGNWANSFSFGIDFKDFDEQLKFGASSDQVPLKYAPFTFGYNGYRYSEKSQLGLGLNLVVGTRAFFGYGSDAEEFRAKRWDSSPSFAVLKGDANYTYTFANDWQSASKAGFQLASGPLVSNEQYSAGGATSVRGYLARSARGMRGCCSPRSCAHRLWPSSSAVMCRSGASTRSPKARACVCTTRCPSRKTNTAWPVSALAPAPV